MATEDTTRSSTTSVARSAKVWVPSVYMKRGMLNVLRTDSRNGQPSRWKDRFSTGEKDHHISRIFEKALRSASVDSILRADWLEAVVIVIHYQFKSLAPVESALSLVELTRRDSIISNLLKL